MKTLFGLSLVALLLSGCNSGENGGEDSSLYDRYNDETEDSTESETVDGEETMSAEEDDAADSIGPSDIPADLVPSR